MPGSVNFPTKNCRHSGVPVETPNIVEQTVATKADVGRVWIGVDPGISGALACLAPSGAPLFCVDMPIWSDGRRSHINLRELRQLLLEWVGHKPENAFVSLERSQPMPRDGTVGAFRYGETYGTIKTLLILDGYTLGEVTAATWRPKMVGRGDKDRSRIVASDLFPTIAAQLSRKKDHGRAEALLLAEYGRRLAGAAHF